MDKQQSNPADLSPATAPAAEPNVLRALCATSILLVGSLVLVLVLTYSFLEADLNRQTNLARRDQCQENLRQIGLALENYHQAHGHYPPAYVADKAGTPLNSWRVILKVDAAVRGAAAESPLGEDNQFLKYQLDLPWDSAENNQFAYHGMRGYQCPAARASGGGQWIYSAPQYLVVQGPGLAFDGTETISKSDIQDDLAETILVVEAFDADFAWTAPQDFDLADLASIWPPDGHQAAGKTTTNLAHIDSGHVGTIHALFADGKVRTLDPTMSINQLRAMLTIAGGE